jgi:hypothetical protein
MVPFFHATWDLLPDVKVQTEAVHRLNNVGVVVTEVANGTSQDGSVAEWREIVLITFEGEMISRCEVFDEEDLDEAIAHFERLQPQARRLENAASRVTERFLARLAAGDWNAIAATLDDDFSQDDRRRVVGAGVRHGRDAEIADLRAIADLSITNITSTVIATRGERLALMRVCFSFRDKGPEAFRGELLGIGEINADERIVADVSFDLDDIDVAFEELDRRYLAGEAAPHAHTWSVIAQACSALNQGEVPAALTHVADVDHRSFGAIAPGDLKAYLRASLDDSADLSIYIEVIHRLTDLGAVVTHAAQGFSRKGFAAEWRAIDVFTVEGDLINHGEMFDEEDLDAALARFEELHRQPPSENGTNQPNSR